MAHTPHSLPPITHAHASGTHADATSTPAPGATPARPGERRRRITGRASGTIDYFDDLARRSLGRRPARRVLMFGLLFTVLARLPLFTVALGIDEGGYAAVARQWNPLHPGSSTYGDLFLDRPPMLLALIKASLVFGDAGFRVLGLVCAIAIVSGVWLAAVRLSGVAGTIVATMLATVYASTAGTGAIFTNAELVGAAFTAWAIALAAGVLPTMAKTTPTRVTRPMLTLAAAGALAACAGLSKQNFVDAAVAITAALIAGTIASGRGTLEYERVTLGWRHVGAFVGGGLAVVAITVAWVMTLGPGFHTLWDALVTFRAQVAPVIKQTSAHATQRRALQLGALAFGLGMIPVIAIAVYQQIRDARRSPVIATLILTWLIVAGAGVSLGGSYWVHYLQQLTVPVALAAGIVAVRLRTHQLVFDGILVLVLYLVIGLFATNIGAAAVLTIKPYHANDQVIGDYIQDRAQPGDTIWVQYARANIVHASTLHTPYPYMWSLMVRGRPGATTQLRALLASPKRPTWVVRWNIDNAWALDPGGATAAAVDANYKRVATVCGVDVYHDRATLHDSTFAHARRRYNGCQKVTWSDMLFGAVD